MSNYNEYSKKRLLTNLEKKFNTTIIGALAAFEDMFGVLWGHGLPYKDLDDEQKRYRELWKDARTRVLDTGNSNLRAAQSELSQYTFSWNRYVTHFKIEEPNEQRS